MGTTYEFEGNFEWSDYLGYNIYCLFPYQLVNSDGVMVYILWEQLDGLDVWRPLPQTTYTNYGALMYSYDFTVSDLTVYLTTDYSVDLLQPADLYNQIFRVVVLPSDFAENRSVAYSTLMSELEAAGCTYKVFDVKNEK
ncbi:MAG: hypothetical protein ACK5JS_04125 [Mangrovibacterium sp.]